MANQDFDFDAFRDLVEGASLVGTLAQDEKAFRAAYAAFRAGNAANFQAVLKRHGLFSKSSLICEWIRIKESVFVCLDFCGAVKRRDQIPDPRALAEAIVRMTFGNKVLHELVDVLEERNRSRFQDIVAEHKLDPLCHFFCRWLCVVHYRLLCQQVGSLQPIERPNLMLELQSAGQSLHRLLTHPGLFEKAVAASTVQATAKLQSIIREAGLIPFCSLICEWFCNWRCTLLCLTLCREFPPHPVEDEISEALAFAKVTQQLTQNTSAFQRLCVAVAAADNKAWSAVVAELKLQHFCVQLCEWVCTLLGRRFCVPVCPPISYHSWFPQAGDFSIAADIDSDAKLTNQAEPGHGSPKYGFLGNFALGGFRANVDPHLQGPMTHRFLPRKAAS